MQAIETQHLEKGKMIREKRIKNEKSTLDFRILFISMNICMFTRMDFIWRHSRRITSNSMQMKSSGTNIMALPMMISNLFFPFNFLVDEIGPKLKTSESFVFRFQKA